jgi:hypothetical protein
VADLCFSLIRPFLSLRFCSFSMFSNQSANFASGFDSDSECKH